MKKLILLPSQIFTGQTPKIIYLEVFLAKMVQYIKILVVLESEQGTVIITIWSVDSVPLLHLLDGGGDFGMRL